MVDAIALRFFQPALQIVFPIVSRKLSDSQPLPLIFSQRYLGKLLVKKIRNGVRGDLHD